MFRRRHDGEESSPSPRTSAENFELQNKAFYWLLGASDRLKYMGDFFVTTENGTSLIDGGSHRVIMTKRADTLRVHSVSKVPDAERLLADITVNGELEFDGVTHSLSRPDCPAEVMNQMAEAMDHAVKTVLSSFPASRVEAFLRSIPKSQIEKFNAILERHESDIERSVGSLSLSVV